MNNSYNYQNPQSTQLQDAQLQPPQVVVLKRERDWLKNNIFIQHGRQFAERHWNELKYTLLGILIAVLFFVIGFWKTILLILLAVIGNVYGRYRDGDVRPLIFLERFFHRF